MQRPLPRKRGLHTLFQARRGLGCPFTITFVLCTLHVSKVLGFRPRIVTSMGAVAGGAGTLFDKENLLSMPLAFL